jgi:hypothetical protein
MVKRLLLGLLKGLVIAGALGALFFYAFGMHAVSGVGAFMLAGLATLIAGVFAGQPPWKSGAWIGSILKGVFGFGLGAGLYWVLQRFAPGTDISALLRASEPTTIATAPLTFMPIIASVYAMLVELDDGAEEGSTADPAMLKKTGVRVENIDVGEETEGQEVSSASEKGKSGARR